MQPTLGEDKAQNSQLVNQPLNQPKQFSQTFDQSSQHVKGSCVRIRMYKCVHLIISACICTT